MYSVHSSVSSLEVLLEFILGLLHLLDLDLNVRIFEISQSAQ
jgi:hypothetical protein